MFVAEKVLLLLVISLIVHDEQHRVGMLISYKLVLTGSNPAKTP